MRVIGIDPGLSGAIAVVNGDGNDLIGVYDMPTLQVSYKGKARTELDNYALTDMLRLIVQQAGGAGEARAIIEKVGPMPKQGVTSIFRFGQSYGAVEAAVAATGIRTSYVTPVVWKRYYSLSRSKGVSRSYAKRLWPGHGEIFKLVKHDGRAEAALIAKWGAEHASV